MLPKKHYLAKRLQNIFGSEVNILTMSAKFSFHLKVLSGFHLSLEPTTFIDRHYIFNEGIWSKGQTQYVHKNFYFVLCVSRWRPIILKWMQQFYNPIINLLMQLI